MGNAPGRQPLAIAVLGPPQITCGSQSVHFTYDKVLALLVYLAVENDRPHTRDSQAVSRLAESDRGGTVSAKNKPGWWAAGEIGSPPP